VQDFPQQSLFDCKVSKSSCRKPRQYLFIQLTETFLHQQQTSTAEGNQALMRQLIGQELLFNQPIDNRSLKDQTFFSAKQWTFMISNATNHPI